MATRSKPAQSDREWDEQEFPDEPEQDTEVILDEFKKIFPEAVAVSDNMARSEPEPWRPSRDNFINLKGKDYLGVRYRLLWMRSDHPDWSTSTRIEMLDWEAGIAVVEGMLHDERGRLIASDFKTETRRDFPDFLEKACTGALGRALACAGYGTEGALELDEGIGANGEPRIADAPVAPKPISITPSAVPGIKQGGRPSQITSSQLAEVAALTKKSGIDPQGLGSMLVAISAMTKGQLEDEWPVLDMDASDEAILAAEQKYLLRFIKGMSFEQAGTLIQTLMAAAA